ncbi:MAG: hypothetical protein ACK55Z_08570, partial [bacterium]
YCIIKLEQCMCATLPKFEPSSHIILFCLNSEYFIELHSSTPMQAITKVGIAPLSNDNSGNDHQGVLHTQVTITR